MGSTFFHFFLLSIFPVVRSKFSNDGLEEFVYCVHVVDNLKFSSEQLVSLLRRDFF